MVASEDLASLGALLQRCSSVLCNDQANSLASPIILSGMKNLGGIGKQIIGLNSEVMQAALMDHKKLWEQVP